MINSQKTVHWGGILTIICGTAIASLFLAFPTGSFWPLSFHNVTLPLALFILPFALTGLYTFIRPYLSIIAHYTLACTLLGATLTTVGYGILYIRQVHPLTGIGWALFVYGFLVTGVGLLATTYTVRRYSPGIQLIFFIPALCSLAIFGSIELLNSYPFEKSVWSAFGISLVLFGYFSSTVVEQSKSKEERSILSNNQDEEKL